MTHKKYAETFAGFTNNGPFNDFNLIRRHWREHLKRKTATEAKG